VVGGDGVFATSGRIYTVIHSPCETSVVSSAMLVAGMSKEQTSTTVIFGLHSMNKCNEAIEDPL
jgi:hypothetical protein